MRDIAQAIGLRSSSTVHGHLERLHDKGYIRRDPAKPRAIQIVKPPQELQRDGAARGARDHALASEPGYPLAEPAVTVPLVGSVTAGVPLLAEENLEAFFPLPKAWIGNDQIFMLRVHGDSMIEAGIHDGDFAIVRRQSVAQNGDIVVAMIDDEATVKRYYREKHAIRLQPENPTMEPIYATDVQILGRVIGIYRRYD